jgi:hypothetical protein
MVPRGRKFDTRFVAALVLMATLPLLARAGDDAHERPTASAAPLEIPHTLNLLLDEKARKRGKRSDNIETLLSLMDLPVGLRPVTWPKDSDLRARLLTPELKRTPVVGWLAENLYRSKKDNGWCLEVDPGEGEYVVFYRYHPWR